MATREEVANRTRHDERSSQIISDNIMLQSNYSKLIKHGKPNLYLLNASERKVSADFQWFEIGRPSKRSARDHKFIILMGATGSGKSTLINGMVNYIHGVRWEDTFRFKCVREDESIAQNQAHSQTSSVTAYTIHHHEGIIVPYSITIIDTPGYGDTRGIERDKSITQMIHRFLTSKETNIDYIHAACFVAASSESRLTVTQRYILDSVLSIFGKDFKDNIRLLVTFADNAVPPVVEACRVAQFPVTSQSVGILYSKFNSSVLFASNQPNKDDFGIDQLFWDMGQENFESFFDLLEGMKGKNLNSTREVIIQRQTMEETLKNLEHELEVYFIEIENMDIFLEKMRKRRQQMLKTNSRRITIEMTEMKLIRVKCEDEFLAYNCKDCKKTCEQPILARNIKDPAVKRRCAKSCSCSSSHHAYENFVWSSSPVKVKTTLADMKAKYQSIFGVTNEMLPRKCSEDLWQKKEGVISLLEQLGTTGQSLDSKALRSNALSPADYLALMRSQVAEEQKPGYMTRLETLTDLQKILTADASASQKSTKAKLQSHEEKVYLEDGNNIDDGNGLSGRSRSKMESQSVSVSSHKQTTDQSRDSSIPANSESRKYKKRNQCCSLS